MAGVVLVGVIAAFVLCYSLLRLHDLQIKMQSQVDSAHVRISTLERREQLRREGNL